MLAFPKIHHIVLFVLLITPTLSLKTQPVFEERTLHVPPKLVLASQWSDDRPELYMYETSYQQEIPLLPIIYFDYPGDYTIPPRYQQFSGSYDARNYTDTNDIGFKGGYRREKYYELLNIIGFRMTEHPSTQIMLQGGYSLEPGENEEIGYTRAKVIQEYLVNVWKIDTSRILLLPPHLGCDSSANILRQEEARHVIFHTGSWNLIHPVSYAVTSMETSPLHLRFIVEPNTNPQDVQKLEIVMTCDDQVVGRTEVPGHPDSTRYRLEGYWWKGGADIRPERGAITVEVLLHLYEGKYRRSNPVIIPVFLDNDSEYYDETSTKPESLYLPFFSYRDSALSGYQRLLIGEFLKKIEFPNRMGIQLTGSCEMSEDPEVDEGFLLAERQEQESMMNTSYYYDLPETGTLYIYMPAPEEDTYDYYIDEYYREEGEYAEESTEVEEESIQKYTVDSLAISRARTVATFLRDSLGIELINESDEFTGLKTDYNWIQQYTQTDGYHPFVYRPEDRWYSRQVNLRIIPEYQLNNYRNWYNRQQDELERLEKELEEKSEGEENES